MRTYHTYLSRVVCLMAIGLTTSLIAGARPVNGLNKSNLMSDEGCPVAVEYSEPFTDVNIKRGSAQTLSISSPAKEALVQITKYKVKADYLDSFKKVIGEYVVAAIDDKANLMAEAYSEKDKSNIIWLIERWEDEAGYQGAKQSTSSKAILTISSLALDSAVQTFTFTDIEPLSKSAWRKQPSGEDKPFTAMLFVDGKSGTEAEFKTRYHQAMPKIREEKGIVTYGLSQSMSDPSKFVTYEKFRSDEAFKFHLTFPPVEPVIDYLKTSIKSPPFEKGLHMLIQFAPLINN